MQWLVGLAAVVIALWLVRDQLQQISGAALIAALKATPLFAIGLSILFTGLSFACLAMVEWQALKIIGRSLNPWRVAVASFTSNAISIVMGFGVVSGAAVRLRTYAFAGLKPGQIARLVVLLQGATFLSGIVAEGLSLLRRAPRALGSFSHTGAWTSIGIAVVLIAPVALWFALFKGPRVGRHPPSMAADRSAALAAGLGDWLFSGAALFILSSRDIGAFAPFMSLFCLGSLLGSAAGVPGGLGVLEAVMLGLQARSRIHETAAALILYRLIYFIGPLALTLAGGAAAQAGRMLTRLVGVARSRA